MVLEELGGKISNAIRSLSSASQVDKAAFDAVVKEVSNALIQADVELSLVMKLRTSIVKKVNFAELPAGVDKRNVIEKSIREELIALLDCSGSRPPPRPKRGRSHVCMFVGLQGNGKTTTCMKFAHYYKRKGFKPAMVCADTFRAGAYDQVKQNATRANVPFYGSYTVTDPAAIAEAGVRVFKEARHDVIIVDTSGRHSQNEALLEEMRAIMERVQPDLVLFVMDAATGQSAGDQARAFASTVDVGGVVITKMDGSAKGGSTLSAVAATKAPVLFIGTGEQMDAFEEFDTKSFVSRLLGRGDMKGLAKKLEEVMPEHKQQEFMEQLQKKSMTLRLFRTFLEQVGSMGPISSIMGMLPMLGNMIPNGVADQETAKKFKRYMVIMDSMSEAELDEGDVRKLYDATRIKRIAYGSGSTLVEVVEMLNHYKITKQSVGSLSQAAKKMDPRNMHAAASKLGASLPPQMLQQLQAAGGMAGMQEMLKSMPGHKLPR